MSYGVLSILGITYTKKVKLLTDHQALQPLIKRNRAHKQYSARLKRWLHQLSYFDVNVQYTACKNIPLTDYLSRRPIAHEHEAEASCENEEREAEEEFVINQIYGLFEFNRANSSITQHIRRPSSASNSDQSQHRKRTHEQTNSRNSIQTLPPRNNSESPNGTNFKGKVPQMSKMDKVNGIDIEFIFKKRGRSPETNKLRSERNKTLQPNRTKKVGTGSENERLQQYRPSQQDRKKIERINIMTYNRFFHYCESLGTTLLKEFNENIHESWINASSDSEGQISYLKTEKCPTNILRKFKKHESVNLIKLKQTAKQNTLPENRNEKTAETIKRAQKDFAMDLPMLVEETAQNAKNLDAIIALEAGKIDGTFYPYRPHRARTS